MPTTKRAGCHSSTRLWTAFQRAAPACASIVVSGRACRVTVLAIAIPVRRSPKSNPSTTSSAITPGNSGEGTTRTPKGWPADTLGMTRLSGELRGLHAEQLQRCLVAALGRRVEQDLRCGGDGQPGVCGDFALELAGAPAGIAERHQHLFRAAAACNGLEHILGRRQRYVGRHRLGRA